MAVPSPPLVVLGPQTSKLLLTFAGAAKRPTAGRPATAKAHRKPGEEEPSEQLGVSRYV